ncbi:aspartyl-tRNA(Asn)/glutamyl-tRNA(Gln) amidotransferase subunit A [Constrictibacter sp. MBR-5]|jgi:aspartyl-tRNA(Asn)/glutamyl-tRNA(Gln) amidotransferase subunit A|uniref:amidase n=1 Tax=Constrictibacter sp. MBR-5 TaxID=3156467 RepID=UPI003392B972
MTDLPFLTVAEASDLIRTKTLSPVEYAEALFAQVDRYNAALDAFILPMRDVAMAEAKRAQEEVAAGNWRGPFHGVPYGLKDIVDVEGVPTTAHSKILEGNVAKRDAAVTRALRGAGGVLMGKLSTHEFAIGGPSRDLPWPPARNPWNRTCHPGGSSSGSGAGIAAGFFPAAIGTDTGGSVRNPASQCGIVGLKPTYGRVSRAGVVPLSFSLDHVGPMTRTVEDNALMLNVIAGHDPSDPGSAPEPAIDYTAGMKDGVKGLRIGVVRRFYAKDMVADAEMAASIEAAVETLAGMGASVTEIDPGPLQEYATVNRIILQCEAFAIHEKWLTERPEDYGARARERLMAGAFYRAVDYVQALRMRGRLIARFAEAMRDVDVAITASSMEPACDLEDDALVDRTYPRQARQAINVTGDPALALPTGLSSAGMPLSMQIIGRPFAEAMVYRVGYAYEQAAGWHLRRPPLEALAA